MTTKAIKNGFWEKHDDDLRQYIEEGLTSFEAAAKLGKSRNAVTGRASRLGLRWHKTKRRKKAEKEFRDTHLEYVEWKREGCASFPPSGRCVYPDGDPRSAGFAFCGERVQREGQPYCETHRLLAYHRISKGALVLV